MKHLKYDVSKGDWRSHQNKGEREENLVRFVPCSKLGARTRNDNKYVMGFNQKVKRLRTYFKTILLSWVIKS